MSARRDSIASGKFSFMSVMTLKLTSGYPSKKLTTGSNRLFERARTPNPMRMLRYRRFFSSALFLLQLMPGFYNRLGITAELLSCLSKFSTTCRTPEKDAAKLGLERFDLLGKGGLGNIELFRRTRYAAAFCNFTYILNLGNGHVFLTPLEI